MIKKLTAEQQAARVSEVANSINSVILPFNVFIRANAEKYRAPGAPPGIDEDGDMILAIDIGAASLDFMKTPEGKIVAANLIGLNYALIAAYAGYGPIKQ